MRNKIYMATNNMFAKTFPYIDQWVEEQGWIEIGSDENSDSLVRAIDTGGLVWESDGQHQTIDGALLALEQFLISWFQETNKSLL